jgi:hypothetical protein
LALSPGRSNIELGSLISFTFKGHFVYYLGQKKISAMRVGWGGKSLFLAKVHLREVSTSN